jgi:hypothetical protein
LSGLFLCDMLRLLFYSGIHWSPWKSLIKE